MKFKTALNLYLFTLLAVITACAGKEQLSPNDPLASKTNDLIGNTPEINKQLLQEQVEQIGIDPYHHTWKDMDMLYRTELTNVDSRELKNLAIFFMISKLDLVESADKTTHEYYLDEISKIDFNTDLSYIVRLINKISLDWGLTRTSEYSKSLYEKNTSFWAKHFQGKTSYLEMNEEALEDLKKMSEIKS